MKLLFLTLPFLFITSCEFGEYLNAQKSYLTGIKVADSDKTIKLTKILEFNQTRGVIKTDNNCYLQNGTLELLWESNSMEFYLSNPLVINCEHNEVGGIAYSKSEKKYFVWVFPNEFNSIDNTILKFKTENFVSDFENLSSAKPSFLIHYIIPNMDIQSN
jgi:hypothetical protein